MLSNLDDLHLPKMMSRTISKQTPLKLDFTQLQLQPAVGICLDPGQHQAWSSEKLFLFSVHFVLVFGCWFFFLAKWSLHTLPDLLFYLYPCLDMYQYLCRPFREHILHGRHFANAQTAGKQSSTALLPQTHTTWASQVKQLSFIPTKTEL